MSITLEVVQVIISFQDLSKISTVSFLLGQVLPSPMVPVWCGTSDRQKQNIFWQKAKVLGKSNISHFWTKHEAKQLFTISDPTRLQTWGQGILQRSLLLLQNFPSALPFRRKRMSGRWKRVETEGNTCRTAATYFRGGWQRGLFSFGKAEESRAGNWVLRVQD